MNSYKNILLIDTSVNDFNIFLNSANADTFPILYSKETSSIDILEIIKVNFTTINRIAIVFTMNSKFLNDEIFFTEENKKFIISLILNYNVANIDYLACNTLNDATWLEYYNSLSTENVIIGASNDKTGNLKYGGDWVMESTMEDISNVYFTENINYYTYLLDTIIANYYMAKVYKDIACSANGDILYGISPDGVYQVDISMNNDQIIKTAAFLNCVATSADGNFIIAGGNKKLVFTGDDTFLSTIIDDIISVACNYNGSIAVACSTTRLYVLLNKQTLTINSNVDTMFNGTLPIFKQVACSFKGDFLYVCSNSIYYNKNLTGWVVDDFIAGNYVSIDCDYDGNVIYANALNVYTRINGDKTAFNPVVTDVVNVFCNGEMTKYGYTTLLNTCSFKYNYGNGIIDTLAVQPNNVIIKGCSTFNGNKVYLITDVSVCVFSTRDEFVSTWTVPAGQFDFPFQSNGCTVNWGDGSAVQTFDNGLSLSHTYAAGIYAVRVTGGSVQLVNGIKSLVSIQNLSLSKFNMNIGFKDYLVLEYIKGGYNLLVAGTFENCGSLKYGIKGASYGVDMSKMFKNCTTLTDSGLTAATFALLTNTNSMFSGCIKLTDTGLAAATFEALADSTNMFQNCKVLTTTGLTAPTFAALKNATGMFEGCTALNTTGLNMATFAALEIAVDMFLNCTSLNATGWVAPTFAALTDSTRMFSFCTSLTDTKLTAATFTLLKNAGGMFGSCSMLGVTGLGLATFEQLIDATNMFAQCTTLTTTGLTAPTFALLKTATGMFDGCTILTNTKLTAATFNAVTTATNMFRNCKALITTGLNINMVTFAALENAASMFFNCEALRTTGLNMVTFAAVLTTKGMFKGCIILTDTGLAAATFVELLNAEAMFQDCTLLTTTTLGKLKLSKVQDMKNMFLNCPVFAEDLSNWSLRGIINVPGGFPAIGLPSFTQNYINAIKPKFSSNDQTWTFTFTDGTDDEILTKIVPDNTTAYKIIHRAGGLRSIAIISAPPPGPYQGGGNGGFSRIINRYNSKISSRYFFKF